MNKSEGEEQPAADGKAQAGDEKAASEAGAAEEGKPKAEG
jgi:hypothetical protein